MADPISTIPGVASGIDWASVVGQVLTLERRPATRLQATIDANTKKRDAMELFRQSLAAMQGAANELRTGRGLDAFTVAAVGTDAGNRNVLAATVGTGAAPGSYALNVTSLAAAQRTTAATGWTAARTLDAAGTLTVGAEAIALEAGDTLDQVRDRINEATGRTGVQASILSTKADGSDRRLVLTGQKAGAANAFTLDDDASGALVAALGFDGTNAVDATDASFTLDGGATVITRPTNVVADALPGVTLTLSARGQSTVTVDRQPSAGPNAVRTFVDAYNKVQSFVKSQSGTTGALRNDSLLRSVRGSLSTMALGEAARLDDSGVPTAVANDLATLSSLGVTVQKDGTLAFDQAQFDAAYPSRATAVRAMLTDRMGAFFYYADGITGTFSGQIDKRNAAMDTQSASMKRRIDDLDSRIEKKRTVLLAQYAKFEASLGRIKSVGDSMTAQFAGLLASGQK